MLSYQHGFHAGNLADVHKHALLAVALAYLTRKDKPLSYIETHAGRGRYDLHSDQAQKTGEAAAGVARVDDWFAPDHPYAQARAHIAAQHGESAYPGSPALAQYLLRQEGSCVDTMHLCELHPQEFEHLKANMRGSGAHVHKADGLAQAQSICPPTPRRGMVVIDPSYEVKSEFTALPDAIAKLHRKWNVGVIALWYPILTTGAHAPLVAGLKARDFPQMLIHEVQFPPAREGHRMTGSGMAFINTPWGVHDEAARLTALF